jgi:hypothetical protein
MGANVASKNTDTTEKEVSFTIPAELYDEFASFATAKKVPITSVFRYALKEFSEYAFPDPLADAKFEAEPSGGPSGGEWVN